MLMLALVRHRRPSIASKNDHDKIIMQLIERQVSTFQVRSFCSFRSFFFCVCAHILVARQRIFHSFNDAKWANKCLFLSLSLSPASLPSSDIRYGKRISHCNVPIFESLNHKQFIKFALCRYAVRVSMPSWLTPHVPRHDPPRIWYAGARAYTHTHTLLLSLFEINDGGGGASERKLILFAHIKRN